ncbi:MAG TPA: hypothetical protein VFW07_15245 [Parafilimonas sp.]|nr:hypothetical protein [Parafilimonas sp.]
MKKEISVTIIIMYILLLIPAVAYMFYLLTSTNTFQNDYKLILECICVGGCGGILYCLRGIYLNYCVLNQWCNDWLPWYIIRPIVSFVCGGVSYLFLKAGLLILEARKEVDATNLGFLAFAFIAGMNVDKFISKIEEIAQATWGIEKSRTSAKQKENN